MNPDTTVRASPVSRVELARIFRLMLPSWAASLRLLLCIAMGAGFGLVPPLMIRLIIDRALTERNTELLVLLVSTTIISAVLGALTGVWRNYLASLLGQGVVYTLRCRLYEQVLTQPLDFFTNTRSGEIMSRLQNDVGGIHEVVCGTLVLAVANFVLVSCTLVVLFAMDWRLALVAASVLPLFIIPARKAGHTRARVSRDQQESLAELSAITQETLSVGGALLVRIFGAQTRATAHFSRVAGELRDLTIRSSIVGRWFLMWVLLFITIGPALIYLVGGHEVISGRMSVGTVVAFVAFLSQLYGPASTLANFHMEMMGATALFRRVFEYLDLRRTVDSPDQPLRLHSPRGCLRFNNVSMRYGRGTTALHSISFEAAPGRMVALVGPSGAGKTTIGYLASRIYDPSEGAVLLDGIDLRQLSLGDVSRQVGLITQETTLFNTSVAENLRYAVPDASMTQLVHACKLAQVHDVISELPLGYATVLGERGYALSGGERQRLSVARALLRNSRVLILDEATSSLDTRSEALVQTALSTALSGRTSLVIAHRLSTIVRADLILVLDCGVIVQRGTHAELLSQVGLYANLFGSHFHAAGSSE